MICFYFPDQVHDCHLEGEATKPLKSSNIPAPSIENGNNSTVPLLCSVHITGVRSCTRQSIARPQRSFDVIKELVKDGFETAPCHVAKSWSHPSPWKGLVPPRTWWHKGENPVCSTLPQTLHPKITSPKTTSSLPSLWNVTQNLCVYLLPWGWRAGVFSLFVSLLFLRWPKCCFWCWVYYFFQAWRVTLNISTLKRNCKKWHHRIIFFLLLTEAVPGLAAATEENRCLYLEEILGIFTTPSLSLSHSKGTKREAGQLRHVAEIQLPSGWSWLRGLKSFQLPWLSSHMVN